MIFSLSTLKKISSPSFFLVGICFVFFLCVFFKNAWVADDAYISFRSIEHVFAGNGPRWNIDERVQVYTSPLWFGLLLIARILSDNLFLGSILLSAICCVGALLIARKTIENDVRWLVFVLLITSTWGVMDFSSSGLENPLLYFLLSAFLYYYFSYFKSDNLVDKKNNIAGLMLSLGFLSISRHDTSTLVFFPTCYLLFMFLKTENFRQNFKFIFQKSYLVWLPLLFWTGFSIVYYGVPFPNTAYAKMLHGVPRAELIDFGLLYLQVSLIFDKFSLLILSALFLRVLWKRELPTCFLFLGILCNFFYIAYVGGDFMQGRFTSEAIFLAAFSLLVPLAKNQSGVVQKKSRFVMWFVAACLLSIMVYVDSPLKLRADSGFDLNEGRRHYSWRGILNERNFYFKTNSLWAYWHRDKTLVFPDHKWCKMGSRAHEENKQITDFGGIGMYGYCAGLDMLIVDRLALGDPFLARLPKTPEVEWRAGHFHRDYPKGYYQSRLTGENYLQDPLLAQLWGDVTQLAREPLFTQTRWKAIWRINTGYYKNVDQHYFADIADRNSDSTPDTLAP